MAATRKKDAGHSFSDYFKRALNPLIVLALLEDRPKYAYEMTAELKERSGGNYTMPLLYPVLYRLEEKGYVIIAETVISEENRTRNYYQITETGKAYLEEKRTEYLRLQTIANDILGIEKND